MRRKGNNLRDWANICTETVIADDREIENRSISHLTLTGVLSSPAELLNATNKCFRLWKGMVYYGAFL